MSALVALIEDGTLAPCRALDVGCGDGPDTVFLASKGFEVTGVDFAPAAIENAKVRAREAGVDATFLVEDITSLASLSGTFDLLIDHGVHSDLSRGARERYLQAILSRTRPGAQLLLSCHERSRIFGLLPMPLCVEKGEIEERFAAHFEVTRLETYCRKLKGNVEIPVYRMKRRG